MLYHIVTLLCLPSPWLLEGLSEVYCADRVLTVGPVKFPLPWHSQAQTGCSEKCRHWKKPLGFQLLRRLPATLFKIFFCSSWSATEWSLKEILFSSNYTIKAKGNSGVSYWRKHQFYLHYLAVIIAGRHDLSIFFLWKISMNFSMEKNPVLF